ncbi:hypothetical protein BYT27DRAFT_7303097 [Phlegmacium glaucopus]|nr:hypothetical protein BYT27DRAFT_7303097 [Phlegmacium glaucopus]
MWVLWRLRAMDWVDSNGNWGPKGHCGFLNNWNPMMLMTLRANHDVKLFMNGRDMNVDLTDVNKRLIQRYREFSGPEIMSYLMGWGDHFESHHYVSIYSNAIISALKDKCPALRNSR